MLRLHRHKNQSNKLGEKLDFRFYGFKALQVPKGWDRLCVSIVSVETGKTVAKTNRASVRNASCQWTETLSESIRVPEEEQEEDSAKETKENCSLFKLIVSMGSSRSGILGEATINAAEYSNTGDPVLVSLVLKKCAYGTTIQVKVQCLTPRSKSRISDSEKPNNENYQDTDMNSEGSGSSSAKFFQLNSDSGGLGSRETSFSLSESHQSYDSADNSIIGEEISENQSEINSRHSFTGSAKNVLEASGGTVEELRAEAKMWEANARKLMLNLDSSKIEQENLKKEIDRLRSSSEIQSFQKESIADLSTQLERSQESNIELVSVLRELEETVERQKREIEKSSLVEEEIVGLREKVQELERDCNELTEENLELLLKVKESNTMSTSVEFPHRTSFEFQLSERQTSEKKGIEEELRGELRSKEEEISDLRNQKSQVEENLGAALQESEMTSKCLNELQNDLAVLTSSVGLSDLETGKYELELRVKELERENSDLVARLKASEGQLERSQLEMQSTFDGFVLECDFLRKSNDELQRGLSECLKKVEELEGYLSSVTAEFELRDKSLSFEIEKLVDENSIKSERVDREIRSLNQIHVDKIVEAEKLQEEVEYLIKKLSETREKSERIELELGESQSRLKNKEIDSEIKLKMLSARLSDSNQELERLSSLVEKYQSGEAKLKAMICDYESQIEQFCEERSEWKTEKNELIGKISSLTTKLLKMDDDLLEMDEIQRELEEIKNENSQYRLKIEKLREDRDKQNSKKSSKTNSKVSPVQETAKITKIQSLEDQLAKALEENNKLKSQLNKFVSENRTTVHSDGLRRSITSDGDRVSKSSIESELRELQERYSIMSLKYAEVEAEREELVMKLRTTTRSNSSKNWFT